MGVVVSYTCPNCQAVSHNPHDEIERYCGRCHKYEDEAKNARLDELLAEAEPERAPSFPPIAVIGPCPSCGDVASRRVYDIGSGPELSCATCEWCWGADGQDLKPLSGTRDLHGLEVDDD
jgi:ssDNA-binding Zn-finger/Zn-ribbon topoisomerase 1